MLSFFLVDQKRRKPSSHQLLGEAELPGSKHKDRLQEVLTAGGLRRGLHGSAGEVNNLSSTPRTDTAEGEN